MAIFKYLPGVEVTVTVDDKALQEYTDPDLEEEDSTVTRYIEAQTDETFKIEVLTKQAATRGAGLCFGVTVDGTNCDGIVVAHEDAIDGDCAGESEGFEVTLGKIRRYRFAKLDTVSTPVKRKFTAKQIRCLGSIEVAVYHCLSITGPKPDQYNQTSPKRVAKIPEAMVKGQALSHSVGFGPMVNSRKDSVYCNFFHRLPIATFKFLYRSREALKQEGIIPRTPSPPPLEDRDFDSLSREEMQDMQRQLKAMKEKEAEREKIKREHEDDTPVPKKRARPSADSEVIDLD